MKCVSAIACVLAWCLSLGQTIYYYDLSDANLHVTPEPDPVGGIHPPTDYSAVDKPLVVEAYADNIALDIDPQTIHPGAVGVTRAMFGGDLPNVSGYGSSAIPIYTRQKFTDTDFPIYLESDFYSQTNIPAYNEHYFFIIKSDYAYFGSPTYYVNSDDRPKEGILIGGRPFQSWVNLNYDIGTASNMAQVVTHNLASNGEWYNFKVILDIEDGMLVVREMRINNVCLLDAPVAIHTMEPVPDEYRLGMCVDDLATGFTIITNYRSIEADFSMPDTVCAGTCVNFSSEITNSSCTGNIKSQWTFQGASIVSDTATNPVDICYPSAGQFSVVLEVSNDVETITTSKEIVVVTRPEAPEPHCISTAEAITFSWNRTSELSGYAHTMANGTMSVPIATTEESVTITDLSPGESVTFYVWSINSGVCGSSDTASLTCDVKQCPPAEVEIPDPGLLCSGYDPLQLQVMIAGLNGNTSITWSGKGVSDSGIFDPRTVPLGITIVGVIVEQSGCQYAAFRDLEIIEQPTADFVPSTTEVCLDSAMHVRFTGRADTGAIIEWDLDGASVMAGTYPTDFWMQWTEPGDYLIRMSVDVFGCFASSGRFITVGAQVDTPVVRCLTADTHMILVEWDQVPGTQYLPSSSLGTGMISDNRYAITGLPDDTEVLITVSAEGSPGCNPVFSTISCQTLLAIEADIFVPNVFSPDGNGINDVFYVQANAGVERIKSLRIFDRWGVLLFEKQDLDPNNPLHGWDGTRSGEPSPSGVYVYHAQLISPGGDEMERLGDFTLVR